MKRNIIETYNLSKKYFLKGKKKEINALNGVNLSISEGEIFGLLGPNGAGKTTLIQILTTIKQPTSGYATINGFNILKNPKKAKSKIALMLENHMLYYRITAYKNLKFFCKIYKVPNYKEKILNLTKEFGLESWLNQYVENFSGGMKMKLALCRTLLLERDILFLDEPTLGLDVKSIEFIIDKLKNTGKTIFLTSHDMNVVEQLCDRVAFINNGNILKIGKKEEISKLFKEEIKIEIQIDGDKTEFISELNNQGLVTDIIDNEKSVLISLRDRKYYNDLIMILSKFNITKINEKKITLQNLFLKII